MLLSKSIINNLGKYRNLEQTDEYESIIKAIIRVFLDNAQNQVKQKVLPILNKLFSDKVAPISAKNLHSDEDEDILKCTAAEIFAENNMPESE